MSGAGGTPVWVDRDGTEEALPQLPRGDYRWPRISPDGTKLLIMRVAEAGNRDIWIYDLITGASRQLTFAPEDDYGSIWNPAGDRVVFGSTRDGSGNLYWRTADGSDSAEQLTTGSNGKLAHTWTRDGRLVYSEVVPGQDRDLFAISPTGDRTLTALLAQPYAERNAAVSPNGRWIAYESTQLGFPGAWVKSFPDLLGDRRISTLDLGRLLAFDLDPTEGRSPIWSRDGNELFYNNQSAIVRIPITSEDPFTTGSPEFLFSGPYFGATTTGPQYDIAGDGRFIMIRTLEGISNELIVVQNWMRELWERN